MKKQGSLIERLFAITQFGILSATIIFMYYAIVLTNIESNSKGFHYTPVDYFETYNHCNREAK